MDRLNGSPHLMIVSDLDHTMVDHHDQENLSLLRFNALWEASYRHNSLLVFSTGRSPTLYKQLRKEKPMLTPDITIMSVGTEITYGESMVPDDGWEQFLNHKWDRNIVREETSKFPQLTLQSETEQRPHKVSFYIQKDKAQEVIKVLSERLEKRGVSNAQEELLQWHAQNAKGNPNIIHATERCAAGIIQAIGHFKLGPSIPPRDVADFSECKQENANPGHEVVKFYLFYERWRRAEVDNSQQYMQNMKAFCYAAGILVHPSGVERSLHDCIDAMTKIYGDKQGKQFRVWVDRVSSAQIGSDAWMVKFDKWELSDEGRHCCLTTLLLNTKAREGGCVWVHLHQTWLAGSGPKDQTTWLF
uniref:Sucrose-phosphatase n=1 Tax=Nelumbo nucifera TaxID=4432 RepID=A0A822XZ03_NELNU|nr:TPA_asm: hypothetical protein HUJ06_026716 [Nelumbo nucifera]